MLVRCYARDAHPRTLASREILVAPQGTFPAQWAAQAPVVTSAEIGDEGACCVARTHFRIPVSIPIRLSMFAE